ncbi:MmgE/PrpD family protein [Haloferacaceae archaeon DSL9]
MSPEPVRAWEANVYDFLAADVPDEILDAGSVVVGDVLAAAVSGSTVPEIREAATSAPLAPGDATILGTSRRVDPTHAALFNAAAAIAQEIEEGHDRGGHVGAGIVAGSIGVAESANLSGREFVAACVKAYELCVRLEYAIFAMKAELNEAVAWLIRDPHSTWTTVGPAIATALCLGVDENGLRETFRTAANLAVVSMHDPYAEGAPARNFTAGYSAQAGVSAALVATNGVAGSASGIEAVYDPLRGLLAPGEFDALFADLGESWEVTRAYLKLVPSCRYTHAPLDALERLETDGADLDALDPNAVDRIDVYTYANAVDMNHQRPETPTSAKFSIPYVLARRIISGPLSLADFDRTAVADDRVRALAERVFVHRDAAFDEAFPDDWGARVELRFDDGSSVEATRERPHGDHRDPPSADELDELFRLLLGTVHDEAALDPAVDALDGVLERPVRDVVAALRPT